MIMKNVASWNNLALVCSALTTILFFSAVRDLSVQVDQLHSQLLDLEEEYGRIYEQLQDLVDSNRDFTQALKEELELDNDVSDEDHETKPDDNVSVA